MSLVVSYRATSMLVRNEYDIEVARGIFHGQPPNVRTFPLLNEPAHAKQDAKIT
jgi:hypothetical protein